MPRGVGDQIGEATLECRRPHCDDRVAVEMHARLVTVALGVGLELFQEGAHVGRRRLLARIAARKRDISLQHAAHLVDVLLHGLDLGTVPQQGKFELETRENGAQVVRNSRQHGGALLEHALDATLHLDEGHRRAANLTRAARPEVGDFASLAETFGGIRQAQNRPDLVAQEQHRHRDQHQRGAHHPGQKDVGVGDVSGTTRRKYAHHRVVELDADLEQCRAPNRIDPVRPADLLSDLLRERLVDQREERLGPRRRQLGDR